MNKVLKSNNYLDYVEQRLEHWANWFSRYHDDGSGYKSYTRAYVLILLRTMIQRSPNTQLPYDEDAEEIEDIISDMAKYDEKMAKVLCTQYIGKGTVSERAKKLGMSYARFRNYVDMARRWVAGRLSTSNHPFRGDTPKY
jgi:hypothetical protein